MQDLNGGCITSLPLENDPPLIVDSNAIKLLQMSGQLLQTVSWWNTEVCEVLGVIQHP